MKPADLAAIVGRLRANGQDDCPHPLGRIRYRVLLEDGSTFTRRMLRTEHYCGRCRAALAHEMFMCLLDATPILTLEDRWHSQ